MRVVRYSEQPALWDSIALCALAAEVPLENRQRGLSEVLLRGMAELAADAGLTSLIAPVTTAMSQRRCQPPESTTPESQRLHPHSSNKTTLM